MWPDSRIQELIDSLRESQFTEVKNWLGGLGENAEKAKLAKEIIALANSGGGRIFIGFKDDEGQGHIAIEPQGDEAAAFTQDKVSAIVHRYCTPAIQCDVQVYRQTNGKIWHPVIEVPSANRVPVFAARHSPDNRTLMNGTVYVRRPGGNSEPCRAQDDWEQLLDRLVRARQDQILDAMRNVLNPEQEFSQAAEEAVLDKWLDESRTARNEVLNSLPLPKGHPLRLERGNYEVAFSIAPFQQPDIVELNRSLHNWPRHSGWPPFVYLHWEGMKPRPMGNVIQAWLVGEEGLKRDPQHSDFWRLSTDGHGYLVRAMEEDHPALTPRLLYPGFDWKFPIYRMTEMLKLIEWLGRTYATSDAVFQMQVTYNGTKDRRLITLSSFRYNLPQGKRAHEDSISSCVSGRIEQIALNTRELVFSLLRPVYSQFDFAELRRELVDDVVENVMRHRQ